MTHALTTKLRLRFALDIFGNQVVPGELDLLAATNNFCAKKTYREGSS